MDTASNVLNRLLARGKFRHVQILLHLAELGSIQRTASAVGAWVGAGRVQLGKHFVSDVVMGAAVGTMSGRTVTIGHGAKKVTMVPTAVPGGAALTFALVAR